MTDAANAEVLRRWDEERMRVAIQASIEEAQTKVALQRSLVEFSMRAVPVDRDTARLQAAIRASLADRGRGPAAAPDRGQP